MNEWMNGDEERKKDVSKSIIKKNKQSEKKKQVKMNEKKKELITK